MSAPLRWYDHNADNPPWLKALAEVRIQATREGWCHAHVQAIIVAIDQYSEAALGNRIIFSTSRMGSEAAGVVTCRDCQGFVELQIARQPIHIAG